MIKIKREDLLDYCILCLLFLEVMIIRWLNLVGEFNMILILLLLYRYLRHIHSTVRDKSVYMYLIILCYFVLNFVMLGGDDYFLFKNIFECAVPLLVMMYFGILLSEKKDFFLSFLKGLFWPLNIYLLINIPVIFLQMNGNYWLSGITESTNTYHVDMISGLLGFNGVPVLALFSAAVIIYDYCYANYWASVKYRQLALIYDAILMIFFSILSLFNDNTGFYFVLLLYIIVYWFSVSEVKSFRKGLWRRIWRIVKRLLPFAVLATAAVAILYKFTPIGGEIDKLFHELNIAFTYGNMAQGSSERFGMIIYALSSPSRLMGFGIGNYVWTSENAFGFLHYGQSDVGTFLCLGGIVFIVLLSVLIVVVFKKAFVHGFMPILLFAVFAMIGIYTQVFTVTSEMVCAMLFAATCWGVRQIIMNGS